MPRLNVTRQHKVNCNDQFFIDIVEGLSSSPQKTLPCKYFYDETGSALFEQICETPEYYPTRTELMILDQALTDVAQRVGAYADVLEFGSGAGIKIRLLLSALEQPRSYCPIDISEDILLSSAQTLHREFPNTAIRPIVADYHSPIKLPEEFDSDKSHRRLVFFPGSTISNFEPTAALSFLKHIRSLLREQDVLLIGVDLIKSLHILHDAYNDSQGVTAAFNKNLLARIKSTYDCNIDIDAFGHKAWYNEVKHRIEMHLVSHRDQYIEIEGSGFEFSKGETIHTENSYKYSVAGFQLMARNAGFDCDQVFTDPDALFSVHFLTAR